MDGTAGCTTGLGDGDREAERGERALARFGYIAASGMLDMRATKGCRTVGRPVLYWRTGG